MGAGQQHAAAHGDEKSRQRHVGRLERDRGRKQRRRQEPCKHEQGARPGGRGGQDGASGAEEDGEADGDGGGLAPERVQLRGQPRQEQRIIEVRIERRARGVGEERPGVGPQAMELARARGPDHPRIPAAVGVAGEVLGGGGDAGHQGGEGEPGVERLPSRLRFFNARRDGDQQPDGGRESERNQQATQSPLKQRLQ